MSAAEQMTSPVIDLAGLKFEAPEDFRKCIRLYLERHPGGYLASIGQNTVIVAKKYLPRLIDDLQTQQIRFSQFNVRSMADLSPEEAAELRRKRGQPESPEFKDRRKVLEDLQKHYGVP